MSEIRVQQGTIQISAQMLKETQRIQNAYRELEWIALHYGEATVKQRAYLDRVCAAIDSRDD